MTDDIPDIWSVSFVVTVEALLKEFTVFIREKFAEENILFYRDCLEFKQMANGLDAVGIRQQAEGIVDLYIKLNSKYEINVAAFIKNEILSTLDMEDAAGDDDFDDSNFFGDGWGDSFDPIDDLSADGSFSSDEDMTQTTYDDDEVASDFSMELEEEDIGPKTVTREQLLHVFDDAFQDIQAQIDRNFIISFQHSHKMKNWLENAEKTVWPYQGFLTLVMMKKHLTWASLENDALNIYLNRRLEISNSFRDPLGKKYKYMQLLQQLQPVRDEFQARLPSAGWVCGRIGMVGFTQLKVLDKHQYRLKGIIKDLQDFKVIYEAQLDFLPLVTGDEFEKMKEKYEELKKLHREVITIKKNILKRNSIPPKANPEERNLIFGLHKKMRPVFFELQEIESVSRANMMDTFRSLYSLEFNRLEKVSQLLNDVVFSEAKLIADITQVSEHILQDVSRNIDLKKEAQFFVYRSASAVSSSANREDPLEGSVFFGPADLNVLASFLDRFDEISISYIESIPTFVSLIFSAYKKQMNSKEQNDLVKGYKGDLKGFKELGKHNSPHTESVANHITDGNMLQKLAAVEGLITKRYNKLKKRRDIEIGNIRRKRITIQDFKHTQEFEEYEYESKAYVEACSAPGVSVLCNRYRVLNTQMKELKASTATMTDQEATPYLANLVIIDAEIAALTKKLSIPIAVRKKLLKKKLGIVHKFMAPRLRQTRSSLKAIVEKQVEAMKIVSEAWYAMSTNVDIVEHMKLVGDEVIVKDTDGVGRGMQQALLGKFSDASKKVPTPDAGPSNNAGTGVVQDTTDNEVSNGDCEAQKAKRKPSKMGNFMTRFAKGRGISFGGKKP